MAEPDGAGDFRASLGILREMLPQVEQGNHDVINQINLVLAGGNPFTQPATDSFAITAAAEDFNRVTREVLEKGNAILVGAEQVDQLFGAASAWTNNVQGPVSAIDADWRGKKNGDLDYWAGHAANIYVQVRIKQSGAVTAVGGSTAKVASWLSEVAKANGAFIAKTAKNISDLVTLLKNTIGSIWSLTGALGVLSLLITSFNDLLNLLNTLETDAFEQLTNSKAFQIDADVIRNDKLGLEGGKWPNSVDVRQGHHR